MMSRCSTGAYIARVVLNYAAAVAFVFPAATFKHYK